MVTCYVKLVHNLIVDPTLSFQEGIASKDSLSVVENAKTAICPPALGVCVHIGLINGGLMQGLKSCAF